MSGASGFSGPSVTVQDNIAQIGGQGVGAIAGMPAGTLPVVPIQASLGLPFDSSGGTSDAQPGFLALATVARIMLNNGATFDRIRALAAGGDGLGVALSSQPSSSGSSNAPAVNTAAQIVFAAVAGQRHRLTLLDASYSAAPAGGNLNVVDGAATIFSQDTSLAGPMPATNPPPGGLGGTAGNALTVNLTAGGAAVSGKLNAAKLTG